MITTNRVSTGQHDGSSDTQSSRLAVMKAWAKIMGSLWVLTPWKYTVGVRVCFIP